MTHIIRSILMGLFDRFFKKDIFTPAIYTTNFEDIKVVFDLINYRIFECNKKDSFAVAPPPPQAIRILICRNLLSLIIQDLNDINTGIYGGALPSSTTTLPAEVFQPTDIKLTEIEILDGGDFSKVEAVTFKRSH